MVDRLSDVMGETYARNEEIASILRELLGIPVKDKNGKWTVVPDFEGFGKIPRLSREIIITEQIDGTNAQIYIPDDKRYILAGSRKRWITPKNDNFGFARWVQDNADQLIEILGPGRHYGEWWGKGIQRGYNQDDKVLSLFNVSRWSNVRDAGLAQLDVVPMLYTGPFTTDAVESALLKLKTRGSKAAPGFMNAEGIIIYHTAGNLLFKKTIYNDEIPKVLMEK